MQIKNTKLKIIKGDITQIKVDAIVNLANSKLVMDDGLSLLIKERGGQEIEDDVVIEGPVKIGEAIETTAGRLLAKYVIHAVVSGKDSKTDEHKIRSACRSSLELAKRLKLKSIAFPALGCGAGGFPVKAAAKIMAQEILKHAKYDPSPLKEIILVLHEDEAFNIFNTQVTSYLNYIQNNLSQGPFITVDIIIEIDRGIVLIERSNPPFGWALPGGFVDYGETLENCAVREAKEETNLDIYDLEQLHTYSDPKRDPRFHTITTVFTAKAKGKPKAGDDAQNLKVVALEDVEKLKLAFNHSDVLEDYKRFRER